MLDSKGLPSEFSEWLEIGHLLRAKRYRGRFAPSPTGPLHLGNLRTALISWLRARLKRGEWLLRIDDLDTPRNRPGAIERIQRDLLWLGLNWDGPIVFQRQRIHIYKAALSALRLQGKLYACCCSRRILSKRNISASQNSIYPGTCRDLGLPLESSGRLRSFRLRVEGAFTQTCGDIVLRRADGFIAYHLATVVDELTLGIDEVVRGEDLSNAMCSQLAVIDALNGNPVNYLHAPLLMKQNGQKLSKRDADDGLERLRTINRMDAPRVIGYLASSLDLVPRGAELSALELVEELRKNVCGIDRVLNR